MDSGRRLYQSNAVRTNCASELIETAVFIIRSLYMCLGRRLRLIDLCRAFGSGDIGVHSGRDHLSLFRKLKLAYGESLRRSVGRSIFDRWRFEREVQVDIDRSELHFIVRQDLYRLTVRDTLSI